LESLAFLRLLQLFDSQFPIGAYVYSGGLETYGQRGISIVALRDLLASQIACGWGRLDLAAMALAYTNAHEAPALRALSAELSAWKVIPSARDSSLRLGRRTLALAQRLFPDAASNIALPNPHHAIVLGVLAARFQMPPRDALLACAQSTLTSALLAATRCMPLSPGQAQEILVELQPRLLDAVDRVLTDPEGSLFAATPALDIRAHQQLLLATRLFQS
jgi:urease accessory protein